MGKELLSNSPSEALDDAERYEMERMKKELLALSGWDEDTCTQKAEKWAKGCLTRFAGTRNLTMQAEGIIKAYNILHKDRKVKA